MLNITRKLVLLTIHGALLAAGSTASHASNVYGVAPSQADEVGMTESRPPYWACPAEYRICPTEGMAITAKADHEVSRTDATVWDAPEQPTWSLEDWMRYYNYSPMILGD